MDFNVVITAHTAWKQKFKQFLEGKERLEAETVAKDNQCELGKWIYGEGSQLASLPEFTEMKKKPAEFHQVASQVVRQSKVLKKEAALALVEVGTDFAKASALCVNAIATLKHKLSAAK